MTSLDAKTWGGWGGAGLEMGGGWGCREKARVKKPNGENLKIFFQRNFIANSTWISVFSFCLVNHSHTKPLGSLSNDNGNGNENVT